MLYHLTKHETKHRGQIAEIGYELASAEWRQGIMSEAVQAVVRFGLTQMGLHRIEAIVDPSKIVASSPRSL